MQTTHNLEPALKTRPDRAEYWALRMTELPSVSGSAEEAAFPQALSQLLRQSPPFKDHPENVWTIPVPGGRHQRGCVAALVRGKGRRTIVLTGHFDTVPIEDYGDLKPLAEIFRARARVAKLSTLELAELVISFVRSPRR